MSSGQATDEMNVLRNKIASLEIQMKMQRVKRENQAAWEKSDREAAKKDLEMKMEIKSLVMQTALENERRDRKDLEQKMEVMKMQAAHALESEKRDRMLENEKRDRILDAALEKKETQHQIESEKRDREAAIENERRDRKDLEQKMEVVKMQAAHALESEKQDRDAALEKKETQHQIEQLKWEARFGQMEQQLRHYSQPIITSSPIQPLQHTVNPSPTQQGEQEQWLLQQLHELKLPKNESSQPQPPLPIPVPAVPSISQEGMAAPTAPIPSLPAGPHPAVATASSMQGNISTTGCHAVPSVSQEGMAAPIAPMPSLPAGPNDAVATASSMQGNISTTRFQSAQPGNKSTTVALPSTPGSTGSSASLAPLAKPSKAVRPQHQVGIGPVAKGGSIPLPGNASNHFFLSHCQATGGDQTNAIYLELRQLGFSCW
jgi:hypothetical protein